MIVILTNTESVNIAIFSFDNDLHALAVQHDLMNCYEVNACHVVETTTLFKNGGLHWSSVDFHDSDYPRLLSRNGEWFDLKSLDLIWYRRIFQPQKLLNSKVPDEIESELINNSWRESIVGILASEFAGCWISDPEKTRLADNKIVQLRAAQKAGFSVPKTLISQDPEAIRSFCHQAGGRIIMKPVRASRRRALVTVLVEDKDLDNDESIKVCPAIYQEYIPGNRHLRIHCFGSDIHAIEIESQELDWRRNLNIPFRPCKLDHQTKINLIKLLNILGLKMGIVDMKLSQDSTPIWLEINPQGQFLFAEGLSGYNLTRPFSKFLFNEARQRSGVS